jgi:uridine kinase
VAGIAGGSASGKSSFTRALTDVLKSGGIEPYILGMDSYFYRGAPGGPRLTLPSTGEDLPDNNHPNSADNVRLVADLDKLSVDPDGPAVIIVEGLMALHVEEIRSRLDVRLFIELDADVRALRRLLRDMSGARGTTDPAWIATYYRECARIGHMKYVEPSRAHADLIVRGDSDFARTAPMVAAVIQGLVASR